MSAQALRYNFISVTVEYLCNQDDTKDTLLTWWHHFVVDVRKSIKFPPVLTLLNSVVQRLTAR
jgi:hypothetical protein